MTQLDDLRPNAGRAEARPEQEVRVLMPHIHTAAWTGR
jgi:hypothetical protein